MKVMKRLAAMALIAAAPMLAQAATTATLTLTGSIPVVRYIGWGATPDTVTASSLDVTTPILQQSGSQTFQAPLQLKEVTNDSNNHYSVTVSSVNAGKLKHDTVQTGANTLSYDIAVSGATNGSLATPLTYTVNTSSFVGLTTTARDVSITVYGDPTAVAGQYSDLISFDITAP